MKRRHLLGIGGCKYMHSVELFYNGDIKHRNVIEEDFGLLRHCSSSRKRYQGHPDVDKKSPQSTTYGYLRVSIVSQSN